MSSRVNIINGFKKCSSCKNNKKISFFCKNKTTSSGLYPCCRLCQAKQHRKRSYGINEDFFNNLPKVCEICGRKKHKSRKSLSIDHIETMSGEKFIRGRLCDDCNTSLGKFNDDIKLLKSAIAYLKRYE